MAEPAPSPPSLRRRFVVERSQRRRFLAGLAVAAFAAAALGALLVQARLTGEAQERAARKAMVELMALSDVLESAFLPTEEVSAPGRSGLGEELSELPGGDAGAGEAPAPPEATEGTGLGIGDELSALEGGAVEPQTPEDAEGDAVRRAVARFAAEHPEARAIRVVRLEGIRLEASTAAADRGAKAAPRRLDREEKPLFDLAQKLRAAVEQNREAEADATEDARDEGGRQEEIAVERLPGGGLALAAPVERAGEVVGMVQMETAPARDAAGVPWLPALAAGLVPVLLFVPLAWAIGERRALLAAASALLLVAAVAGFGRWAQGTIGEARRATSREIAGGVATERARAEKILADLEASPTALEPGSWDVDLYRRSLGQLTPAGEVDEGALAELIGQDASGLTRSIAVLALAALVLLAFVGFGGAARMGANLVEYRVAYAYVAPALLTMLVLVFFPFFYGILLSFTNANIYNTDKPVWDVWVGVQNYVDILSDTAVVQRTSSGLAWNYQNFYWTLGFTVVWTITNVAIGVSLGLGLALALNTKGLALRPIYRVILILPWALPTYITALVWRGMFHPQFGVINQVVQLFGGEAIAWFDRPLTAFATVLATNGWLSFPFMMVISLGALQSIPGDLYEAARVDGATRWQQFKAITLPSLKPALVPAVIISVIWTFNQFNVIYLVSGGEPSHATEILITQAYKLAFEQYRYGYAAAYSVIIFLILLVYGTWQNRTTKATESIG